METATIEEEVVDQEVDVVAEGETQEAPEETSVAPVETDAERDAKWEEYIKNWHAEKDELQTRIVELTDEISDKAEDLKILRADLKVCQANLAKLHSRGPKPEPQEQPTLPGAFSSMTNSTLSSKHNPAPAALEDLSKFKIEDVLELKEGSADLKLLNGIGVYDLAAFERVRGKHIADYPHGLESVENVGPVRITKWEDQLMKWIADNPDAWGEEESDPENPETLPIDSAVNVNADDGTVYDDVEDEGDVE